MAGVDDGIQSFICGSNVSLMSQSYESVLRMQTGTYRSALCCQLLVLVAIRSLRYTGPQYRRHQCYSELVFGLEKAHRPLEEGLRGPKSAGQV